MDLFLFYPPVTDLQEKAINHAQTPIYEPLQGATDSSEFSGHTVRVKDQRTMFTEDCIAAGCPEDLW